jgi:nicotinamidase-related amidase
VGLFPMMKESVQEAWVHVCVDMQLLFAPGEEWGLEWLPRVLPRIIRLCEADPSRTIFTRFIPARRPGEGQGRWRDYYERWADLTLEARGGELIELVPDLRRFAPPAEVIDKPVYSPWLSSGLRSLLEERHFRTLLISGGETDMCVLSTVLGAVDWGYRTILITDCVCSASDEAHDAMLRLFSKRYNQHVETATVEEVLEALP